MEWRGRWEGGSGWGTHVHPWLIHVNVWQKPPQYCKVTSLQLKKKKKDLGKRARSEVLRSNLGKFLNLICNTHSLFCYQSPGTYNMSIFSHFVQLKLKQNYWKHLLERNQRILEGLKGHISQEVSSK